MFDCQRGPGAESLCGLGSFATVRSSGRRERSTARRLYLSAPFVPQGRISTSSSLYSQRNDIIDICLHRADREAPLPAGNARVIYRRNRQSAVT